MEKELISVIVPVYNVEQYLPKCIDSIINQTYSNLEIILIDDGSTDKSGRICDCYKEKDERIKVIHKPNGGLSSARNKGLEFAKGDLIGFVDSDDYLELTMYEHLINGMKDSNADISMCNFYYDNNGIKKIANPNTVNCYFEKEIKYHNIYNEYSAVTIHTWNKLYKKYIFDYLRFPDGLVFEDTNILCDILSQTNKIAYISEPLYNYVFRSESIFHSFSIKHFDNVGSSNRIISFFEKNSYKELAIKEKNRKSLIIISNLSKTHLYHINNPEIYNKYYNELLLTVKELKWNESSKYVKRFKIFKKYYIYFRYIEYKLYYWIKGKKTK